MRRLAFVEPTHLCTVLTREGRKLKRMERAASDAELRDRLSNLGYTIVEIESYSLEEWKKSASRARTAALAAIAKGDKPAFDDDIWRKVKAYLFHLSEGRCGYCEALVEATDAGAVEHYRPKAKVTEDPAHPGYYWLAYELSNYIPSCDRCNSGVGKGSQFPVAGTRAFRPEDDLGAELPLLLHPFDAALEPEKHLRFLVTDPLSGVVQGITAEGKRSIEVYDLNRAGLVQLRRAEIQAIRWKLRLRDVQEDLDGFIRDDCHGNRPFWLLSRAVAKDYLAWRLRQFAAHHAAVGD
jgi:hypothetical protein